MRNFRSPAQILVLAAVAAAAMSCGSSSGNSASPSPTGGDPPPTAATTIVIANNAVSPKTVTVPAGSQVTFVNNDSRPHEIFSNPHPEHTDCPEINQVGHLEPGQSRQTGNLNTIRTCGFHDHINFEITALQGSIVIH